MVAKARGGEGAVTGKRVTRAFTVPDQELFFLSHSVPEGDRFRAGILVSSDGLRPWIGRELEDYPEVGAWGVKIHFTAEGARVEVKSNGGYADMYVGEPELDFEHLEPDSGYYAGEEGLLVFGAP